MCSYACYLRYTPCACYCVSVVNFVTCLCIYFSLSHETLHAFTALCGVFEDKTPIFLIYYVPHFSKTFCMLHLLQNLVWHQSYCIGSLQKPEFYIGFPCCAFSHITPRHPCNVEKSTHPHHLALDYCSKHISQLTITLGRLSLLLTCTYFLESCFYI